MRALGAFLVLSSLTMAGVQAATKDESYQLYEDMFGNNSYNKYVRPTIDTSTPTYIYMAFKLMSLVELDEKAQSMKTNARIQLVWDDEILSWDPAEYGDQEDLFTHQENMWVPDLMVDNSVVRQKLLGFDELPVRIKSDGIVLWEPNILLQTSCDIEVTYYPFDSQLCYIDFSTQITTYDEVDINIEQTEAVDMSEFSPDGTWDIQDYWAQNLDNEAEKSKIRFSFVLKRRTTFYVINIILPVLFLSMTAALVFALPADSGEKMGTSITVLLAYAVYLTIVSAYLPNTSLETSVLALYLTILLGITALSVVVSVFVLRIYFRPESDVIKPWQRKATIFLRTVMCKRKRTPRPPASSKNAISPEPDSKEMDNTRSDSEFSDPPFYEEKINWRIIAETLDWLCFLLFSLLVLASTLACMVVLVVGGDDDAPSITKTATRK